MRVAFRLLFCAAMLFAADIHPFGPASAQDRITRFASGDRAMDAAIAAARSRLPEFFDRFRERRGERHSVKIAIPVPNSPDHEHIWMGLRAVDGGRVRGFLTNEPDSLPGLRLGSPCEAPVAAISDWSYWSGGLQYGNYTTRVIVKQLSRAEASSISRTLSPEP